MSDSELSVSSTSEASSSFPYRYDGWTDRAERFRPGLIDQFAGLIVTAPSGGGSDYADARYYVQRAISSNSSPGDELAVAADALPGVAETVTATNLAELAGGTHALAAGTVVQVSALYARSSPGVKVYVFNQSAVATAVVEIVSAASGNGEYDGKILGGVASAGEGSALEMPMGMTAPTSNNALILDLEENGQSGHRLAAGSYAVGVIRGSTSDTPPRSIVFIGSGVGRTDSPTVLTGGSDPSSETADSTSWSKASDATPLNLNLVARVVYNPSGDQKLYAFVRTLSFDARGVLLSVGGEARVTVSDTESCP